MIVEYRKIYKKKESMLVTGESKESYICSVLVW